MHCEEFAQSRPSRLAPSPARLLKNPRERREGGGMLGPGARPRGPRNGAQRGFQEAIEGLEGAG
eukprot:2046194-Pyramimonas_sp.AAC.1